MPRVDNPEFSPDGEVYCSHCPFLSGEESCRVWWYRNKKTFDLICPTTETYQEACDLAAKGRQ